ncbi:MAG: winged helix-turn-helix transcriptional regulator [Fidelibacterota bacterium]
MVANILIHREYNNAFPARLIIQRDSVITENANNPVGHGPIDPDNFNPHPKNPAIVKFFQQLGRAEELGSGIRNIRKYLPIYSNNARFELIEKDNFKTIISFTDIFTDTVKKTSVKIQEKYGRSTEKGSEKSSEKILKLISQQADISAKDIAEKIGISPRAVEKHLARLKSKNIIKRIGPDKGGHWEIIKQE